MVCLSVCTLILYIGAEFSKSEYIFQVGQCLSDPKITLCLIFFHIFMRKIPILYRQKVCLYFEQLLRIPAAFARVHQHIASSIKVCEKWLIRAIYSKKFINQYENLMLL